MQNKERISGWQTSIVSQLSLKHIFGIAVSVGAIFIAIGVLANSFFMGVVLPIAVMAGYGLLVLKDSINAPRAVVGDSCYYLGFIFTLVSLIASLWLIRGVSEDGQVNFSQIVSSFGLALVTTVIGLVMRLIITSFDVETKQRQEQIERDIEHSLEVFKGQIDTLTSTVITSIVKVSTETNETITNTLKRFEDANLATTKLYSESMERNLETIKVSVDGMQARIDNISISEDMIVKPVMKSLKGLTDSLTGFSNYFSKAATELQSNNEQLAYQLAGSTDTINKHIDGFEQKLNDVIKAQAAQYRETLADIGNSVVESIGDFKDINIDAQSEVEARLKQVSSQLDSFNVAIEGAIPAINSNMQLLVEESEAIQNQMADSPKILKEYINTLEEFVEKLSQVEKMTPGIDKLQQTLVKFEELIDAATTRVNTVFGKLEKSANTTEEHTNQVANDIASVYSNLALELQKIRSSAA